MSTTTLTKTKRKRTEPQQQGLLSHAHPLGIKPYGNRYIDSIEPGFNPAYRLQSLGDFAFMPDEIILAILATFDVETILRLGSASQVLYAFTLQDEMWKNLTIDMLGGQFKWQGTWRKTLLSHLHPSYQGQPAIRIRNFYSDTLYQSFICSSLNLDDYGGIETIERCKAPSKEEFHDKFASRSKPVILTDVITKWPAYKRWSTEYLTKHYGDVSFRAESIDIKLAEYFKYASANQDESPLYLFDKNFGSTTSMGKDYSVPEYFDEDFFNVFEKRPDYRWLIVGPARSGSTFHKDPNATSAWNAVITGSKRWIMFPPGQKPPGVFTNEDESEVTSPFSIAEWLYHYHSEAKGLAQPPLEGTCRAGEVLFVPSGWWHLVVNLEDSIAVTQNYVGRHNVADVLSFLANKPAQITGFAEEDDQEQLVDGKSVHDRFLELMQEHHPNVTKKALQKLKPAIQESKWSTLKDGAETNFSFNFDD